MRLRQDEEGLASNKEEGERWQDKSTVAEERLSGCLHIQDLEIALGAMSLQIAKRFVSLKNYVCIGSR